MKNMITVIIIGGALSAVGWKIIPMMRQIRENNKPTNLLTAKFNRPPWQDEPAESPLLGETLIHGATVTYFDLEGDTVIELENSLTVMANRIGEEGETRSQLVWLPGNPSDGRCGSTTGVVQTKISVLLPRWQAGPQATDDAKRWWSHEIHLVGRHEQHHVDITLDAAQPGTDRMRQTDCVSAPSTMAGLTSQLIDAQFAYDHHNKRLDFSEWGHPDVNNIAVPVGK